MSIGKSSSRKSKIHLSEQDERTRRLEGWCWLCPCEFEGRDIIIVEEVRRLLKAKFVAVLSMGYEERGLSQCRQFVEEA